MLWPDAVRAQEPEATVTVLAGAGVSLSDESAAIPSLRVTVDSPAFVGQSGDALGRLRVDLVLSGLPGETVKLEDPLTWTSAELYGEGQRRIGSWGGSESLLVVRGGFITRILPRDEEPRQRFARTYTAGLRAQHRGADGIVSRSIALMYGRSEVASPDRFHAGQVVVEGHVRLATVRGVDVTISGDAHLTLGKDRQRGERDVMRLGVAVGWGG